jgi:hypothetical protein
MRKLIDPNDPFFAPTWRRWLVTVGPLAWAGVELWNDQPMWALLFGMAGGYVLLIKPRLDK